MPQSLPSHPLRSVEPESPQRNRAALSPLLPRHSPHHDTGMRRGRRACLDTGYLFPACTGQHGTSGCSFISTRLLHPDWASCLALSPASLHAALAMPGFPAVRASLFL